MNKQEEKVPVRRLLWTNSSTVVPADEIVAQIKGFATAAEAGLSIGDTETCFVKYTEEMLSKVMKAANKLPNNVVVMHTQQSRTRTSFSRKVYYTVYRNLAEAFARTGIFDTQLHKYNHVKLFDENGHLRAEVDEDYFVREGFVTDAYEFKLTTEDAFSWNDRGINLAYAYGKSHYCILPRLCEKAFNGPRYSFAKPRRNGRNQYKYWKVDF